INLLNPEYSRLSIKIMDDAGLPFSVTLVTNKEPESMEVVALSKKPFSNDIVDKPLGLEWPVGYISLSHVALPFPPDDPLYGMHNPENPHEIFLGTQSIQGERGLFVLSADWLLRVRHNPFYEYLEKRVVDWVEKR
ncbi:MAG: hypothetical protein IME97_06705, partial [Proteobacteria bacterium]|nr:hypothetical protein [Pseudomonadota bacterium]